MCPNPKGPHKVESVDDYNKRVDQRLVEHMKDKTTMAVKTTKKGAATPGEAPAVPHMILCPDGQRRHMMCPSRAAAEDSAEVIRRTGCAAFASFATPFQCPNPKGAHTVESVDDYNKRMDQQLNERLKEKTMAAKTTKKTATKKGAKGARATEQPAQASEAPAVPPTPAVPPPPIAPPAAFPPSDTFGQSLPDVVELHGLRAKLFSGTEEERVEAWKKIQEIEQRRRIRDINERVFSNAVATATAATVGRVEGNLLELTKALVDEARRRDQKKARKKERVHIVLKGGGLDIDITAENVKEAAKRLRKVLSRIDPESPSAWAVERTLTLQFPETLVPPGGVESLRVRVEAPFQNERFLLNCQQLSDIVVEDVRVGGKSMFDSDGLGVVPGTAYGVESVGVGTKWTAAQPGQFIVVKVRNTGKVPAMVRAACFGRDPGHYSERT